MNTVLTQLFQCDSISKLIYFNSVSQFHLYIYICIYFRHGYLYHWNRWSNQNEYFIEICHSLKQQSPSDFPISTMVDPCCYQAECILLLYKSTKYINNKTLPEFPQKPHKNEFQKITYFISAVKKKITSHQLS